MAIFALDPDQLESAGVRVEAVEQELPTPEPMNRTGSSLEGVDASRFIVYSTELGNAVDETTRFTLEDSTRVIISALGEITSSSQFDYGWLEDASSGIVIWEMTWENTFPAGGDDSYRRAREELTLPPGSYAARFRTDGSISYESFGSNVPDNPQDWGIAIFRADL